MKGAIVVSSSAVLHGQDGLYVYVVTPEGTVEPRPVVVGPTVRDLSVIENGLSVGERVAVAGQTRLRPGARVEVTEATVNEAEKR